MIEPIVLTKNIKLGCAMKMSNPEAPYTRQEHRSCHLYMLHLKSFFYRMMGRGDTMKWQLIHQGSSVVISQDLSDGGFCIAGTMIL